MVRIEICGPLEGPQINWQLAISQPPIGTRRGDGILGAGSREANLAERLVQGGLHGAKEVRWSAAAETRDDQGSEARTCRACPLQAQHHFDQTAVWGAATGLKELYFNGDLLTQRGR
jgi:hypothetical protein